MHAPITFAAGYNELSSHPYFILRSKGIKTIVLVGFLTNYLGGRARERDLLRLPHVLQAHDRRRGDRRVPLGI